MLHSGHNSVFGDKNGKLWTARNTDHERQLLAIDRIDFDDDGKVITDAPTVSLQSS